MAIITCPECGHQVSTRAASCPGCGCPISTGNPPSPESTDKSLSIRDQRQAQLPQGARLWRSSEYTDTSVRVRLDEVKLADLVGTIEGWCEELILQDAKSRDISPLFRLPRLKSLVIDGKLDDEALLQISKLQTLEKLNFRPTLEGRFTEKGWLFLTRLTQLDILHLLLCPTPETETLGERSRFKDEFRRRMPNTIIK